MELKVNGKAHSVYVPGDMPLLWVLRDVIGLTGTKFGCGIAAFWRADPEDLRILDGPDDRKRAELISERLTRWRSITSA